MVPDLRRAAIVVMLLVADADVPLRVGAGVAAGIVLAVLSSALLHSIARRRARSSGPGDAVPGTVEAGGVARLAPVAVSEQVRGILRHDPSREETVHVLAWRAARPTTPDGQDAVRELAVLWKEASIR